MIERDIYYKRLIKEYGLWHTPKMTGVIIQEARLYNWSFKKKSNISFHWKDIAKDLDVTPRIISNIVNGKNFPTEELMKKLIKYFDLDWKYKRDIEG